jgi:hypothetical protein
VWSATSAATTVEGTAVTCQPSVRKPILEICSPVALTLQEDWSFQPTWRNNLESDGSGESAQTERARNSDINIPKQEKIKKEEARAIDIRRALMARLRIWSGVSAKKNQK